MRYYEVMDDYQPSQIIFFILRSMGKELCTVVVDWLQSFKHLFINVSYHILVASQTLMALS